MRSEDSIVISDKISKLNIYGRVRHPINSNSGEVQCGTQPVKGINSARGWVNGYSPCKGCHTRVVLIVRIHHHIPDAT